MKFINILLLALCAMSPAFASPGAHGPNGEHLDGPAATAGGTAVARVETFTESFELVGHLAGGELSVLIDRYETNAPVLNGKLEVAYKGLKAQAKFHADIGDYAIDDPKLLAALSKPGSHPLLFTLIAGDESDLLEGTLVVRTEPTAEHDQFDGWPLGIGAALAAAIVAAIVIARRRLNRKEK
ncbi:hypothetical protein HHL21_20610 [Massilia sp. RP-1-19]|uniref:Uncharacterized protein n=1 Tax=Massilia polaris TaxID=2728846 RepID=A0A848HXF2_9BURK|nr:hypothetical protein [Massilia polaris]NML63448.1 hypothetical protein [Massilia polaris]